MKPIRHLVSIERRSTAQSFQRRRAFTLFELLVVIGVIALGSAMLLPALAKTRPNSRLFQCMNNQRQLTAAWLMYAGDCKEMCPTNAVSNIFGENYGAWTTGWLDWGNGSPLGANTNTQYLLRCALGPYTKLPDIYKCPADIYASGIGPRVRSVSMNGFIGDYINLMAMFGNSGYRVYNRLTEFTVPGPARTFVFVDECPDSINDNLFQVNMPASSWSDVVASLHNGAGGISFADGHVEIHKWVDSVTRSLVFRSACGTYGKVSPNDYLWLQTHTSALK